MKWESELDDATVHDATGTNVGRLANGSAVLASAVQVADVNAAFQNITATPRAIKTPATTARSCRPMPAIRMVRPATSSTSSSRC